MHVTNDEDDDGDVESMTAPDVRTPSSPSLDVNNLKEHARIFHFSRGAAGLGKWSVLVNDNDAADSRMPIRNYMSVHLDWCGECIEIAVCRRKSKMCIYALSVMQCRPSSRLCRKW